jgi:hypothetical protein
MSGEGCRSVYATCTYFSCLFPSYSFVFHIAFIYLVLAALDKLAIVLRSKKISVLVLDDISSLFRGGEKPTPEILYTISSSLTKLAGVHGFAILVVNQVSASFPPSSFIKENCGGGDFGDVPALGLSW